MDQFDVQFDDALDLTIVRVLRPATKAEVQAVMDEEIGPRNTTHVIWDVQAGALQALDIDDLKDLVTSRRAAFEQRPQGHTFLIGHCEGEEILLDWYRMFKERVDTAPVTFHRAQSIAEARDAVKGLNQRIDGRH